jgi:hypothetical protein
MNTPTKIRPFQDQDKSFIIDSWAYTFGERFPYRYADKRDIRSQAIAIINHLLTKSDCLVACDPEDDNILFGWICWQEGNRHSTLHMVYCKKPFRTMGLATDLIKEAIPNFGKLETVITMLPAPLPGSNTHLEETLEKYHLIYDPFLIFESYYKEKFSK